jgi:hypothetical protein
MCSIDLNQIPCILQSFLDTIRITEAVTGMEEYVSFKSFTYCHFHQMLNAVALSHSAVHYEYMPSKFPC